MTDRKSGNFHCMALMNQKGGVGKTTTTANLGAAMTQHGARVLLIDLDPQAHLSLHLGLDPGALDATVYDLLIDDTVDAGQTIVEVHENLHVLPAEVNLAGAETEMSAIADKQFRLKKKLKPIIDRFDYVLIDCPPSLGLLTINALACADEVLVPMQPHFLALQGFSKLLETVQMVRQGINPTLKVGGVILCMHEKQTTLAREVIADLDQFFQASRRIPSPWQHARVFGPPVRRNIKLAECPSFGQTIFQYSPWCPGARDYRRLAEVILERDEFQPPPMNAATPEPADPANIETQDDLPGRPRPSDEPQLPSREHPTTPTTPTLPPLPAQPPAAPSGGWTYDPNDDPSL